MNSKNDKEIDPKRAAREAMRSLAVIGEKTDLQGVLRSSAAVRLSGSFKGFIYADHELVVTPDGRVEAKVMARRAVIAGLFRGEMIVRDEIEIAPTGRFLGVLIQKEPHLRISRGGRFEGRSVFVDDLDQAAAGWKPPELPPPAKGPAKRYIALEEIKI